MRESARANMFVNNIHKADRRVLNWREGGRARDIEGCRERGNDELPEINNRRGGERIRSRDKN